MNEISIGSHVLATASDHVLPSLYRAKWTSPAAVTVQRHTVRALNVNLFAFHGGYADFFCGENQLQIVICVKIPEGDALHDDSSHMVEGREQPLPGWSLDLLKMLDNLVLRHAARPQLKHRHVHLPSAEYATDAIPLCAKK